MTNIDNKGGSFLTEPPYARGGLPPPRGHPESCADRIMNAYRPSFDLYARNPMQQHSYWRRSLTSGRNWNCECCADYANQLIYSRIALADEALLRQWNRGQYHEKESRDLGPREFTLTYSTSWFDTDESAQLAMRIAIEKLTRYYAHEIIEFHAIGEFTRAGCSHIHGWYNLAGGRKITDKNFKRAWPRWNPKRRLGRGFEGGHHETINRLSDFHAYTEKHLEESWLIVNISNAPEEIIPQEEASESSEDDLEAQV